MRHAGVTPLTGHSCRELAKDRLYHLDDIGGILLVRKVHHDLLLQLLPSLVQLHLPLPAEDGMDNVNDVGHLQRRGLVCIDERGCSPRLALA